MASDGEKEDEKGKYGDSANWRWRWCSHALAIDDLNFIDDLKSIIDPKQETHIVGDFNICYITNNNNNNCQELLDFGFR